MTTNVPPTHTPKIRELIRVVMVLIDDQIHDGTINDHGVSVLLTILSNFVADPDNFDKLKALHSFENDLANQNPEL